MTQTIVAVGIFTVYLYYTGGGFHDEIELRDRERVALHTVRSINVTYTDYRYI